MKVERSMAGPRTIVPSMRLVFVIGCVLVAVAGVQLYVLTEHTDRFFAWTIGAPLAATFLGAFYWTACVMSAQNLRKRYWHEVRAGVFGVFVFELLTLATTLLHADLFHFDASSTLTARVAAFAWLAIYVLDPLLIVFALYSQLRAPAGDAPRQEPFPAWYRAVLIAQGVVLLVAGGIMFLSPHTASQFWPWTLTPLTSRAMSAWVVAVGLIQVYAAVENAGERIDVTLVPWLVVAALQVVALLRYSDDISWSAVETWLYLAMLGCLAATSIVGLLRRHQSRIRELLTD